MKQLLITLSTLTTLTLTSNTIINSINDNTVISSRLTNKSSINNISTSLFNNQYGYLSDDDWITNQSTIDHKYYSYDTSHADYLLSDGKTLARTLFTVDDKGELVYKKDIIIPEKDKVDVNNTKQEMITNCQVTINNNDNFYSNSQYSTNYFTGFNSNKWIFFQEGGIENHIDISQQAGGHKVEHSDNLSETLGLYYIAKAVRQTGGIDEKIADSLASYFMEHSSLKKTYGIVNNIINLIITNNVFYNFINQTPMCDGTSNLYKNYSLDYIFNNDKLVEVYYNNWNNDNIESNVNWHDSNNFGDDWWGYDACWSDPIKLINWKQYTNSWEQFKSVYSKLSFDSNSYLKAKNGITGNWDTNNNLNANIGDIKDTAVSLNSIDDVVNSFNSSDYYKIYAQAGAFSDDGWTNTALYLWHDDNYIYCRLDCIAAICIHYSVGPGYDISLNNVTLTNTMS
ncbi:MAG: hypothetical protein H9Q65_05065 [Spiroplasma ixodetis]|nr:hypothetical protein [Spiroplasma ixodetis]MBP1528595.1 hypothetical protein [Spiroplasma ixodetis]